MSNRRDGRRLCSTATQTTKPSTSSGQGNSNVTQYPSIRGFPEPVATRRNEKNRPGCSCYLKKRYETPGSVDHTEKKKTCSRCYNRKETTVAGYDQPEPFAGSTVQFYETYVEPESWDSFVSPTPRSDAPVDAKQSQNRDRLTPQEVMSVWIPGKKRTTNGLFAPNENYVDVSPRAFSLKKYCPEMFLSDAEKAEIAAKERQAAADAVARKPKCHGRSCGSKEPGNSGADQDWETVLENTPISRPCMWSDEEIPLARERDEVTDEELKPVPKTTSDRSSKWFRWFCGNSKRKKKRDRDKQQDKEKES